MDTPEEIIANAIATLTELAPFDGAHHKQYALDQVLRVLTACPTVEEEAVDYKGQPYSYTALGKSHAYREVVRNFEAGEDGPQTYVWDEGIAP